MSRIDDYDDDDLDFSDDRYEKRPKRRKAKAGSRKAPRKHSLDFDSFDDDFGDSEYDFDPYEDLDEYRPDDHGSFDSY